MALKCGKNDKNEIKKQVIYLYVCYPPGLEDYSSRPGIVSRSLSRGGFLSLSVAEKTTTKDGWIQKRSKTKKGGGGGGKRDAKKNYRESSGRLYLFVHFFQRSFFVS